MESLREALSQTQKQLAAQQLEIETLKARSKVTVPATDNHNLKRTRTYDLTSHDLAPPPHTAGGAVSRFRAAGSTDGTAEKSPTGRFKFDGSVLELGGFVDLENIFRTTNTQNNIATAFGSIPYSNTPQGHITEFRTTAQFSRFNVKFTGDFAATDHCLPRNRLQRQRRSECLSKREQHTNRLRLYFVDLKRGKWEFLGGQTWSWLTPNRTGIGPMPDDLALTYNEDQNLGRSALHPGGRVPSRLSPQRTLGHGSRH